MSCLDYLVRLYILVVLLATTIVCIARAFRTDEVKARFGNVAFGCVTGVLTYAQIQLRDVPPSSLTYLLATIACIPCAVYIVILFRKGLK